MNVPAKLRKPLIAAGMVAWVLAVVGFAPAEPSLVVIVDAGHGGSDPGNLGTGRFKTTEKDITLKVALKLRQYIEERMPDVEVVMTRTADTYPTLKERVQLANSTRADLFISVHCDAFTKPSAVGSSTFVMGMHKNDEALRVAQQENSAIYREANHEEDYAGFDPEDPDTFIALALKQSVYQTASLSLAAQIQSQFRERVSRKDRGVKQAGYYVISFTQMPSVLVELGFLTNPAEEDFLNNDENQSYMASAIFRAFRDWKAERDAVQAAIITGGVPEPAFEAAEPVVAEPEYRVPADKPPAEPVLSETGWPAPSAADGAVFRVQVAASETPIAKDDPRFQGLPAVVEYLRGGLYKYAVGKTTDRAEAESLKKQLRAEGFPDAFVVAFDGEHPR